MKKNIYTSCATGESFIPQKKHPVLKNIKIIDYYIFVGHFGPPGSGSAILMWIFGSGSSNSN
jgi:hypothetical protein